MAISRTSSVILGLAMVSCLTSAAFLVMPSALADNSSVDKVQLTVPSSCTMGGVVDTPHTVSLISGQSASDIGQTTIKAWCNDAAGYSIYAVGAGNNEDGNTKIISNIKSDYDIQTGLSMSGTSSWAMKLTAGTVTNPTTGVSSTPPVIASDTEGSFTSYHTVPSTYQKVAYRTSGTDMETDVTKSGSYLTTTYRIYVNNIQPAGTYEGHVKYAMVHPYDAESSTLKSLYMVFEETYGNTNRMKVQESDTKSYYTMQSMTNEICNAATIKGEASQVQLIDARDKKLYWVTKLEDGNCWMTQNLDLDLTSGVALTSETTDLRTSGAAPYTTGYTESAGVISWTPQDWTSTSSTSISATTRTTSGTSFANWVNGATTGDDAFKDGFIHPLSADPGDWYQTGTYFNSVICNYLDGTCSSFATTPYATNGTHGHVGNYYNWTAAIASNDTYGTNSGNQQNSICPKGWTLPVNGAYTVLNNIYNQGRTGGGDQGRDSGLFGAPLYFARSGGVNDGSLSSAGNYGNYWSSTVNSSQSARNLDFSSASVYHEYYGSRCVGFSVRCVAR